MTGIDPAELRALVIAPALSIIGLGGDAAEEVLLGTALQESGDGRWLQQRGGPALGVWEMEPATHDDIWKTFLGAHLLLSDALRSLQISAVPPLEQLRGNLYYACAMARVKYFRSPDPLPATGDLEGQAALYVRAYNAGGKATTAEYVANWRAAFPGY